MHSGIRLSRRLRAELGGCRRTAASTQDAATHTRSLFGWRSRQRPSKMEFNFSLHGREKEAGSSERWLLLLQQADGSKNRRRAGQSAGSLRHVHFCCRSTIARHDTSDSASATAVFIAADASQTLLWVSSGDQKRHLVSEPGWKRGRQRSILSTGRDSRVDLGSFEDVWTEICRMKTSGRHVKMRANKPVLILNEDMKSLS